MEENMTPQLLFKTIKRHRERLIEINKKIGPLINERNSLTKSINRMSEKIKKDRLFTVPIYTLVDRLSEQYDLNPNKISARLFIDYVEVASAWDLNRPLNQLYSTHNDKLILFIYDDEGNLYYEFDSNIQEFLSYQTSNAESKLNSAILTVSESPCCIIGKQVFNLNDMLIDVPLNSLSTDKKLAEAVMNIVDKQKEPTA